MRLPNWGLAAAYGITAIELGGFVVGVVRWRQLGRGQRMIASWFGAAAFFDLALFIAASRFQNGQPPARIWFAFSVILALQALASFQQSKRRVAALHLLAAAFLVAWVILLVSIEPLGALSTYTAPLHALVILGAAVVTLQRRAVAGRAELLSDPGFLIAAGLSGYAVAVAFETLVAQLWVRDFPQYAAGYYAMCNVLTALAELVIIKALMLPPSFPSRKPA